MFGELSDSYQQLSLEQRQKLAALLVVRGELLEHSTNLNKLRLAALNDPTPANEEAIQNYATSVVAPTRRRTVELTKELLGEAVDVERLMSMLPMVLLSLMPAINLPLFFSTLNLDPDMIEKLLGDTKTFFRRGM